MADGLTPKPLTAAAFAPYGQVIETAGHTPMVINQGTTERFHDLAAVDAAEGNGRALINIFRGSPRLLPIEVAMMECHPLGSQAFFPLQGSPYLVVVGPPAASVAPRDVVAFLARGDQGVNYNRGTWHHPLLVLDKTQDFLVVDRGGDGNNLRETHFDPNDAIQLDLR